MTEQFGSARRIPRAPRPLNTATQASAFLAAALVLCGPVMLNIGGCPPQDAMNGLGDGSPSDNNGGATSPRDDLAPAGEGIGEAPASGHAQFATVQGLPLQFVLRPEQAGAEVRPITQPAVGSLDGPEVQSDGAARFLWTPPADFVGDAEFSYVVRLNGVESDVGTVRIVVYPEVRFSVLSVGSDVAGLTVEASARTVGGQPLPDGEYAWSFGGEQDSGPMSTHASRSFTFTRGGTHAVTLTLTLAGLSAPYGCKSVSSGNREATVSVPPALSGVVTDDLGQPLADVRLTASGGAAADTDSDGRYVLRVPYGWSGDVTPALSGWSFEPLTRSYSGVVADRDGEGFVGANNEVRNVLSGYVRDEQGQGIGGVRVSGSNGASTTESAADGGFSLRIPRRWSGMVTPSHAGMTFTPPSRAYTEVMRALGGQNFTGLSVNIMIEGYVRRSDASPIPGVTLTFSNGGGSGRTNDQGYYGVEVPDTWTGRITPSAEGYTFDPAYRDVGNSGGAGGEGENFVGIPDNPGGGNEPPMAGNQNAQTLEDTPVVIALNGSDPDGDPLQWVVTSLPEFGSLVDPNGSSSPIEAEALPYVLLAPPGGGSGNQVRFVPEPDRWNNGNPPERFRFVVFDGELYSEPDAAVSVTITSVNDPPRIEQGSSLSLAVDENSQRGNPANQFQLSAVDPDAVANGLNWSIVSGPSHGVAGILGPNPTSSGQPAGFDYEPTPGYRGADELVVRVTDDMGGSASVEVIVTVGGVGISGSIALVPTVGHRPPLGEQELLFRGSGAWAGSDFTARTEVSGAYLQVVPEGWTGELVAADPDRLYLTPETREYAQPVVSPLSGQDLEAWTPPIGIPAPPFGIREQAPAAPDPWNGMVSGWFYVDNTHPDATDTNNPNGWPARPRLNIPISLPAGSVVEVHGGPYDFGGDVTWTGNGTPSQPVFLRGVDEGSGMPIMRGIGKAQFRGGYFVVEGLDWDPGRMQILSQHIVLRGNEFRNAPSNGVTVVGSNAVISSNRIHEVGNLLSPDDKHGITVAGDVERVWVLDNDIYRSSGDGIQFCHLCPEPSAPSNVYIGRNRIHDNIENAVDFKTSRNVVVSQNEMYGHQMASTSDGTAVLIGSNGLADAAVNIWVIFNDIHDNNRGIRVEAAATADSVAGPAYLLGNSIYRTFGDAIKLDKNGDPVYIVGNTVYDADTAVNADWRDGFVLRIYNNIFSNLRGVRYGNHINIEPNPVAANSVMSHNLFWQSGGSVVIRWGGSTHNYGRTEDFGDFSGGTANRLGDPAFADAGSGNFRIFLGSAARNAGEYETMGALSALYEQLFGEDIRRDLDGLERPREGAWDMGAWEWDSN